MKHFLMPPSTFPLSIVTLLRITEDEKSLIKHFSVSIKNKFSNMKENISMCQKPLLKNFYFCFKY